MLRIDRADVEVLLRDEAGLVLEELRVEPEDAVEPLGEERAGEAVDHLRLVLERDDEEVVVGPALMS